MSEVPIDAPVEAPVAPRQGSKPCTLCHTSRDVLIRCQIDDALKWHFVCPGKCWKSVSGGDIDGDADHPHYRYGGVWKNKKEAVSGKRKKAKRNVKEWSNVVDDGDTAEEDDQREYKEPRYTKNDRVEYEDKVYVCRKSHWVRHSVEPSKDIHLWKEE